MFVQMPEHEFNGFEFSHCFYVARTVSMPHEIYHDLVVVNCHLSNYGRGLLYQVKYGLGTCRCCEANLTLSEYYDEAVQRRVKR